MIYTSLYFQPIFATKNTFNGNKTSVFEDTAIDSREYLDLKVDKSM